MLNCPFCEIDKTRTRVIQETLHARVILSNPRLMPGHTLVIPKRHIEKPSEFTAEERQEIFNTVLAMQEKIMAVFSSGCDIRQNCRPFMPQSRVKVDHVHFHLQPREMEDELYQVSQIHEKQLWQDLAQEEMEKFLERFHPPVSSIC